jgi:hypothetical protein
MFQNILYLSVPPMPEQNKLECLSRAFCSSVSNICNIVTLCSQYYKKIWPQTKEHNKLERLSLASRSA